MKAIFFGSAMIIVLMTIVSCSTNKRPTSEVEDSKSQAKTTITRSEQIIEDCIYAHGGDYYTDGIYKFEFRGKTYSFELKNDYYKYTLEFQKGDSLIIDQMTNDGFHRFINNIEITLSEKDYSRYSNALNSVIYFAALPFKLNDPAVNATYIGTTQIENQSYDLIEVTFEEDGGGKDFDDVFYYWINTENQQMDYLAYKYHTHNGGIRFRTAFNSRRVNGILFQDYINYKAELETPLEQLPQLYEEGKLEELSKILIENISHVNLKS